MFKRLRERITEEASKSVAQLGNNANKSATDLESKGAAANSSEDLITLSESSAVVVPHTISQQFSIGDDDEGSVSEQSTPQKINDVSNGSTANSTSGVNSGLIGSDTSFSQEYRPKRLSYIPQSDIESEREDPPTLNLEGISKEQLLSIIDVLKARTYKYKNKYSEVVKNYKELREEKTKIEKTLIDTQDKGSRRIAELREQCQLEQKAKAHLEANLRLMLEEKDSRISVLETQINLLKDASKENSSSNLVALEKQSLEQSNGDLLTGDSETSFSSEASALQEKVERLEHQLSQAKKTFSSQTEQISLLRKQNENLSKELEEKVKRVNDLEDEQVCLKSEHESIIKSMQARLEELEKQQEESAMAMAETKKNMHEELEFKEKQLVKAEKEASQYQSAVELEKQKAIELQKRYEEKISELQCQLESTEKTLEEEKQNLMQELARGKTAAITLMQKDCAQKISAVEEEWKAKLQDLQKQISQVEKNKDFSELSEKLKQCEAQVQELNSLVLQLENENESLKNANEKLKSENENRTAEYEKLQVSYADLEYLRKQECLNYEEKVKELSTQLKDVSNKIIDFDKIKKEYDSSECFLKEQLNEKLDIINSLKSFEKELKVKIEQLENEVKHLNFELEKLKLEAVNSKQREDMNIKEINQLQECIQLMQKKENNMNEELILRDKNLQELRKENSKLYSHNASSNDKAHKLQSQLQEMEINKCKVDSMIQKADTEIQNLNDILRRKQSQYNQLRDDFVAIERSLTALEKEQAKSKKALKCYETVFENIFQRIRDSCKTAKTSNQESISDDNDYPEDIVIIKELEQKFDVHESNKETIHKTLPKRISQSIYSVEDEKNGHKIVKNKESQSLIEDLVRENAKLRRELHDAKELSDSQSVDYAENISELQRSLNDLHEERNNLSLVLQSLEAQSKEIKSDEFSILDDKFKYTIYEGLSENKCEKGTEEINFMDLNSKVRSEIEALSSQTEMINQELKLIRNHFNASKIAFSEKIMQLNSKLLSRTEMLLRVKGDLDSTVESAETLKTLLEEVQKQLDEKKKVLAVSQKEKKDLENKLKSLKDKHIKKESDIKQAHNVQLSELKNQTKSSIDKLNAEIQKANFALQKKEEEFSIQLSTIQDQCNEKINKFLENFNEISKLPSYSDKLFICHSTFEYKLAEKFSQLDSYFSKIDQVNLRLHSIKSKLKEKDILILNQQKQIEESNIKLLWYEEQEKNCKELCEREISTLKEKYSEMLEETKIVSSLTCEKKLLESQLAAKQSELEEMLKKNAELSNNFNKASTDLHSKIAEYEELLEHNTTLKNQFLTMSSNVNERESYITSLESNYSIALKTIHEKIYNLSNTMFCSYDEFLEKIFNSYNITDKKLKSLEEQLLIYKEKSNYQKIYLSESEHQFKKVYQMVEKCFCQINEASKIDISVVNLNDNYSMGFEWDKKEYVENLDDAFLKLENAIMLKMEEFEKQRNDLTTYKNKIQELETKYNFVQASLDSYQGTDIKLQEATKELNNKTTILSSMMPLEEFEKLKQKYHEDIKAVNEKYSVEIKELKSINVQLQKEIDSNLVVIEQKNRSVGELEVSMNEILKEYQKLKEVEEQYKKMLNQLEEENEMLKSAVAANESEIMSHSAVAEEKNLKIKDLETKLAEMKSEMQQCNQEVNKLSNENNFKIKELENIIEALENDKNSFEIVLKEKDSAIQNLEHKILALASSNVSLESFEASKRKFEETINNINDRYETVISDLKKSILKLESDIEERDSIIIEKNSSIEILESKMLEISSMIPVEEFENYKLKTEANIEEMSRNFIYEITELKKTIENLDIELGQLKSSLSEKDELLEDIKKLDNQLKLVANQKKLEEKEFKFREIRAFIVGLQKELTKFQNKVISKEKEIQKIQIEQVNAKSQHDESYKCLKEKYENAEKNYSTQMEEMRQQITLLEKDKILLEEENSALSEIKEELSEKKLKLKSQGEDLRKEYLEKIQKLQEKIKDQDNKIVKLEAELESLAKETSEKIETYKKKIKSLELEREQLMHEAQERVSATEAKYREDLKALQNEKNKMYAESKESELLKEKVKALEQELQENLKTLESSKADSNEKISQLKEQLSATEEKLLKTEAEKQASVNELIQQLKKFEAENNQLISSASNLESLKSEKEALNEKLKQTELQMSSYKKLETERNNLMSENALLLEQLQSFESSKSDSQSLSAQNKILEETVENLKNTSQRLEEENEKLKSEIKTLKDSFDNEISSLKVRNEYLSKQIDLLEKLDISDINSSSVKNYIASVRSECEKAIKDKEDDMAIKLKLLVRDFAEQMDLKDRDCDKITSEIFEKNQYLEETLTREHKNEIAELRQNLFEKECALDDIRDEYEEKLQEKDKKIKEYEATIKNMYSTGSGASQDSALLTAESSDWDDTWAVPEESLDNITNPDQSNVKCEEHVQEIESLKDELSKCNSEIKELKVLLRLSPPESMVNNNSRRDSLQSIPEPTEFEYLKNIIYEYMMGKEPITLVKVIAAVLKFSETQTQQVIHKEESRHHTK